MMFKQCKLFKHTKMILPPCYVKYRRQSTESKILPIFLKQSVCPVFLKNIYYYIRNKTQTRYKIPYKTVIYSTLTCLRI